MVISVAWSPDGETLASTSDDGTVRLWDRSSERCIHVLRPARERWSARDEVPECVTFHPQGHVVATASRAHLRLWDLDTGAALKSEKVSHTRCLSFSADGASIASAGDGYGGRRDQDGIALWATTNLNSAGLLPWPRGRSVRSMCLDPRSDTLFCAGTGSSIRGWSLSSQELVRELVGLDPVVNAIAIDTRRGIAATGGRDKTVKFWDLESGRLLRMLEGHTAEVTTLSYSKQADLLASASFISCT